MNPENQNPTSPTQPVSNVSPTSVTTQQPTLTPPAQPVVTQEIPKPKSKILPILIILFIITVLGALGYWVYKNYYISPKPQPATEVIISTPTSTPDPTAEWKIYTLDNYSFKLPNDFKSETAQTSKLASLFSSTQYPSMTFRVILNGAGYGIECQEITKTAMVFIGNQQIKITNYQGVKPGSPVPCETGNSDIHTIVAHLNYPEEKLNDIAVLYYKDSEINAGSANIVFDQILSTFKFVDQTEDISTNWKTYLEKSINLTFKYPDTWSITKSPGTSLVITITPDSTNEQGFVPIQISIDSARDNDGEYLHFDTIQQAKTQYLKSLNSGAKTKENFLIGGKPAISIEGTLLGPGPGTGNFLHYTFIQLDGKVLVIQLGNEDLSGEFSQILSTFKFSQ